MKEQVCWIDFVQACPGNVQANVQNNPMKSTLSRQSKQLSCYNAYEEKLSMKIGNVNPIIRIYLDRLDIPQIMAVF